MSRRQSFGRMSSIPPKATINSNRAPSGANTESPRSISAPPKAAVTDPPRKFKIRGRTCIPLKMTKWSKPSPVFPIAPAGLPRRNITRMPTSIKSVGRSNTQMFSPINPRVASCKMPPRMRMNTPPIQVEVRVRRTVTPSRIMASGQSFPSHCPTSRAGKNWSASKPAPTATKTAPNQYLIAILNLLWV